MSRRVRMEQNEEKEEKEKGDDDKEEEAVLESKGHQLCPVRY